MTESAVLSRTVPTSAAALYAGQTEVVFGVTRLNATLQSYPRPTDRGTLVWDSDSGEVSGSLAETIITLAREAQERGWVSVGPQFNYTLRIKDPLHTPNEFAAIVAYAGYLLPPALLVEFKLANFPDPLKGMTVEERRRTVF